MIDGVTNAGAIPVLERMMQFAGQRHEILLHNIANISTPNYQPVDVSVVEFQEILGEAIDRKRSSNSNRGGNLRLAESQQIAFNENRMTLRPEPIGENILFHDGSDRNVEHLMQGLVENFLAFRMAAQFIKRNFDTLDIAIRGRI